MNKYIHQVTVWRKVGMDRYTQPVWGKPLVIRARWEDVSRLFVNGEGREVKGDSTVYLEVDGVNVGDHIMLGVSNALTPTNTSKEVRDKRVIPNLRNTRREIRVIV